MQGPLHDQPLRRPGCPLLASSSTRDVSGGHSLRPYSSSRETSPVSCSLSLGSWSPLPCSVPVVFFPLLFTSMILFFLFAISTHGRRDSQGKFPYGGCDQHRYIVSYSTQRRVAACQPANDACLAKPNTGKWQWLTDEGLTGRLSETNCFCANRSRPGCSAGASPDYCGLCRTSIHSWPLTFTNQSHQSRIRPRSSIAAAPAVAWMADRIYPGSCNRPLSCESQVLGRRQCVKLCGLNSASHP